MKQEPEKTFSLKQAVEKIKIRNIFEFKMIVLKPFAEEEYANFRKT
jgi:hypothetical protein